MPALLLLLSADLKSVVLLTPGPSLLLEEEQV